MIVRDLIIQDFLTRIANIRVPAYYTDIGHNILYAERNVDPSQLPFANIFPLEDVKSEEESDFFKKSYYYLPFLIECGTESDISGNKFYGVSALVTDVLTAFSTYYTYNFEDGSYHSEDISGIELIGEDSLSKAFVSGVSITSGTFAAGTAAGTLILRGVSRGFQEEALRDHGFTLSLDLLDLVEYEDPKSTIEFVSFGTDSYDYEYYFAKFEIHAHYDLINNSPIDSDGVPFDF